MSDIVKEYIDKYKEGDDTRASMERIMYIVLFSNSTDVVICRSTKIKKECWDFVFLSSKNFYAFRKENQIRLVQDMEMEEFCSYFSEMEDDISIPVFNSVFSEIQKKDAKDIFQMIKDFSDELSKGLMTFPLYQQMKNGNYTELKNHPDIWEFLAPFLLNDVADNNFEEKKCNPSFVCFLTQLKKEKGFSDVKHFAEEYFKSPMETFIAEWRRDEEWRKYQEPCKEIWDLPIEELTEYLCYTLFNQGETQISWDYYVIYCNLQKDIYFSIKNPYPESFITEFESLILLQKKIAPLKTVVFFYLSGLRKERAFSYKDYSVFIPLYIKDLMENGLYLGYDFSKEQSTEFTKVCFIQKNGKPVLWIRLEKENDYYEIKQVEAKYRRTELTEEEQDIVSRFCFYLRSLIPEE